MKKETVLLLLSKRNNAQKKGISKAVLIRKGESILQTFSDRVAPYYLPIDWEGLCEHVSENTDFESFSFLPDKVQEGIDNLNWTNIAIGGGLGAIAGLTYGYWDWNDAKKQAALKGLEKPNKKKILIRDTLVGLGLGSTAGAFADRLLKILEDKKTTKQQKTLFDSIEKEILKGQDKKKINKYIDLHKDDLNDEQYKFLKDFAKSMTERTYRPSGGRHSGNNAPGNNPQSNKPIGRTPEEQAVIDALWN